SFKWREQLGLEMSYVVYDGRWFAPLRRSLQASAEALAEEVNGEVVLQLKATPLAFTVTVMDLYAVAYKVRQDTLLVYEPLIIVTVFYVCLTLVITRAFRLVELQVPIRR
ncbi:hypothetical protein ACE04B_27925, partial [Rhizobium phaseoli]